MVASVPSSVVSCPLSVNNEIFGQMTEDGSCKTNYGCLKFETTDSRTTKTTKTPQKPQKPNL
ncbi:hypothetical protein A9996_11920 [Gelidibacter algens]|nr:hypothetical protein A9996_11920 [Gelidibacter algens]